MPAKIFDLPDIGHVHLTKKRGQKNIRLRIAANGTIKVSAPWSVPAKYALQFVASKQDWIKSQQQNSKQDFYSGMGLGKNSQLQIIELSSSLRSRLHGNNLNIYTPGRYNEKYNKFTSKAIIKVLRNEAEELLISRLYNLSKKHNFDYHSITIKQLTGRWGSCDSKGNISLSLFLVQLPWPMIDYVIVHELSHTQHMNHSSYFWQTVEDIYPDYRSIRKKMRDLQPRIYDTGSFY